MYGKNKLDCFYFLSKFDNHKLIKDDVLNAIDKAKYESPQIEECEVNISKTDWSFTKDSNREWMDILAPHIAPHIGETYASLGYNAVNVTDIWFQQYLSNSEHGWHIHGNNFTNVYYLELPEDAPKTMLIDPFTQQKIIELDVKEGDTVLFPSFVLHKTQKNKSDKRKTIVSWNVDVGYPDDFYTKFEEL